VLVGEEFRSIHRAGGMAMLGFGPLSRRRNARGEMKMIGKWALHLECPWRFRNSLRILVGSNDLYEPPENPTRAPAGWKSGAKFTLYDERIGVLFPRTIKSFGTVRTLRADRFGGLQLTITPDLTLEVFPNDTGSKDDDEFWRFFRVGDNSSHVAATRRGLTS